MATDVLTPGERARLCQQIEAAQQEAEHHYCERQRLADCVADLLCQVLGERVESVHEAAGLRGTTSAVLLAYLHAAFGPAFRPEPLWLECAGDIVAALGRRSGSAEKSSS